MPKSVANQSVTGRRKSFKHNPCPLTQSQLKNCLDYSRSTGVFVWKTGKRAGQKAGSVGDHGYRRIQINGKRYLAGRLAYLYVEGEWPPEEIDHMNGDEDDNRWCNLRAASRSENAINRGVQSNNKFGMRGVSWHKGMQKWCANIKIKGKQIYLGSFFYHQDAIHARWKAEREHGFHDIRFRNPTQAAGGRV